jgi:hypothetical protein
MEGEAPTASMASSLRQGVSLTGRLRLSAYGGYINQSFWEFIRKS